METSLSDPFLPLLPTSASEGGFDAPEPDPINEGPRELYEQSEPAEKEGKKEVCKSHEHIQVFWYLLFIILLILLLAMIFWL